jgi:hypothetical protein
LFPLRRNSIGQEKGVSVLRRNSIGQEKGVSVLRRNSIGQEKGVSVLRRNIIGQEKGVSVRGCGCVAGKNCCCANERVWRRHEAGNRYTTEKSSTTADTKR